MVTSGELMVSLQHSTTYFFRDKAVFAEFVKDLQKRLEEGLPSIITIRPMKYEDSSVAIVTTVSLDDIVIPHFLDRPQNTSNMDTPDGSSQ